MRGRINILEKDYKMFEDGKFVTEMPFSYNVVLGYVEGKRSESNRGRTYGFNIEIGKL